MPSEIVIVKDGPLTYELEQKIGKFILNYPKIIKFVELKLNKVLGKAL